MGQDANMVAMNGLSQEYRGAADARSLLQTVLARHDRYRSDNLPAWALANSHYHSAAEKEGTFRRGGKLTWLAGGIRTLLAQGCGCGHTLRLRRGSPY